MVSLHLSLARSDSENLFETSALKDCYVQKINLYKRNQVITRYALIRLSLVLSYLKFCEVRYLSNYDLSSPTIFLYHLYFFAYFLPRTKFMFDSFVLFILSLAVIEMELFKW